MLNFLSRVKGQGLVLFALLGALCAQPAAAQSDCWDGQPVSLTPSGLAINTSEEASRFLAMATFGPRPIDVDYLSGLSMQAWLDEQYLAQRSCHLALLRASSDPSSRQNRMRAWWQIVLTGPDQLRQRLAFGLSEIMVVSERVETIPPEALAAYNDLLAEHAFGNFRDLLTAVATSPAMGRYLSMQGNEKPDADKGVRADENFARELMQLFTIGLVELEDNGKQKLDSSGKPIPTYSQADVENLARALTGWTFAGNTKSTWEYPSEDWDSPMIAVKAYHDSGEKVIVGGTVIPAGGSAESDLDQALDALFQHPNVGPFISHQLIQRLVTSNPSPGYIKRVATVFNDNGSGVRGDLWAVTQAILLDKEALGGVEANERFGRLREPLVTLAHLWRSLEAYTPNGGWNCEYPDLEVGQAPLVAPSVFNWFRPDYAPNGVIEDYGLVAPEFQLMSDSNILRNLDTFYSRVIWNHNAKTDGYDPTQMVLNTVDIIDLAAKPGKLVDYLDLMLTHGSLPGAYRTALIDYLKLVPLESGELSGSRRTADAIFLIMSSPTYLVFR